MGRPALLLRLVARRARGLPRHKRCTCSASRRRVPRTGGGRPAQVGPPRLTACSVKRVVVGAHAVDTQDGGPWVVLRGRAYRPHQGFRARFGAEGVLEGRAGALEREAREAAARACHTSGWTAAPPPHTEPGPRNSWLFVPLIHAGAGLLSHTAQRTWSAARVGGARFDEIAAALRESAPQQPALLLRALRTLLACEARDDALSAHNPRDLAMAAELEALPAAPLPLAAAVSLCMGRDWRWHNLHGFKPTGESAWPRQHSPLPTMPEPYCIDRSPSKRQLEAVTAPRMMQTDAGAHCSASAAPSDDFGRCRGGSCARD